MKLDFEEFSEKFWNEYISQDTVPNSFFYKNSDFILEVTYDMYRIYENSENLSMSVLARVFESFYKNSLIHRLKF